MPKSKKKGKKNPGSVMSFEENEEGKEVVHIKQDIPKIVEDIEIEEVPSEMDINLVMAKVDERVDERLEDRLQEIDENMEQMNQQVEGMLEQVNEEILPTFFKHAKMQMVIEIAQELERSLEATKGSIESIAQMISDKERYDADFNRLFIFADSAITKISKMELVIEDLRSYIDGEKVAYLQMEKKASVRFLPEQVEKFFKPKKTFKSWEQYRKTQKTTDKKVWVYFVIVLVLMLSAMSMYYFVLGD